MSSVTLYRASGLALLLGLALIIISTGLSFAFQFMTPQWWVVTLGWNIGSLLLLLGLPGICARQALRAGWLGFAGFLLTFISVFLTASFFFRDAPVHTRFAVQRMAFEDQVPILRRRSVCRSFLVSTSSAAHPLCSFLRCLPREPDPAHALDGSGAGEAGDPTPTISQRAQRSARVGDLSEWRAQRATGR